MGTLLSVVAGVTEGIRLVRDVANLPLRPPAVLAGAAASLDILSGGRVELGLGSGAFTRAVGSLGGPERKPGAAVDALAEAITVIRSLWTPGPPVNFNGEHYTLRGAQPGPFPVHPIGIWLGSYKPRMLRLTGRLADGWIPTLSYAAPAELGPMTRIIDEAARDAGPDSTEVRRVATISRGALRPSNSASWMVHRSYGWRKATPTSCSSTGSSARFCLRQVRTRPVTWSASLSKLRWACAKQWRRIKKGDAREAALAEIAQAPPPAPFEDVETVRPSGSSFPALLDEKDRPARAADDSGPITPRDAPAGKPSYRYTSICGRNWPRSRGPRRRWPADGSILPRRDRS